MPAAFAQNTRQLQYLVAPFWGSSGGLHDRKRTHTTTLVAHALKQPAFGLVRNGDVVTHFDKSLLDFAADARWASVMLRAFGRRLLPRRTPRPTSGQARPRYRSCRASCYRLECAW